MKTREVKMDGSDPFKNLPKSGPAEIPQSANAEFEKLREKSRPKTNVDSDPTVEIVRRPTEQAESVYVKTSTSPGPMWVRQDLPSLFVPYSFKEVFLKPLEIPALAKLFAANQARSLSLILDTLNDYVSVDIRDLTPSDFQFTMYWLRENSFKRSPLTVTHNTRYGNEVQIKVLNSDLEIIELQMTSTEFADWKAKGLCFPTMRDAELIKNSEHLPDDQQWMLEYAQYVALPNAEDVAPEDYVDEKIAQFIKLGTDTYLDITAFSQKITHGITETIKFRDPKFDPEAAITYFETQAQRLVDTVDMITVDKKESLQLEIIQILDLSRELFEEAKGLRDKLEKGEKIEASEEVVAVNLTATDFFPSL